MEIQSLVLDSRSMHKQYPVLTVVATLAAFRKERLGESGADDVALNRNQNNIRQQYTRRLARVNLRAAGHPCEQFLASLWIHECAEVVDQAGHNLLVLFS